MKKERSINRNFGAMIKYLRTQKGMSLYDLSEVTGVSPSYINRLERMSRKCPSFPIIEKLALALSVPLNELLEVADNANLEVKRKLSNLILSNECEFDNDIPINIEGKQKLLELINTVLEVDWVRESLIDDIYEISQKVEEFKESIEII